MRKKKEIDQLTKDAPFVVFPKIESSPALDRFDGMLREVLRDNLDYAMDKIEYTPRCDRYNEGGYYEITYIRSVSMPTGSGLKFVEDARIRFFIYPDRPIEPQIVEINRRMADFEEWQRINRKNWE